MNEVQAGRTIRAAFESGHEPASPGFDSRMRSALQQAPRGTVRRRWGLEVAAAVLALIAVLALALPRVLTLQTHSTVSSPSNGYRIAIAPREPNLLTILDGILNAQVNNDGT